MRKRERKSLAFVFILISLFIFQKQPLFCQAATGDDKITIGFVGKLAREFTETLLSPLGWDGNDFLTFSAVIGTGLLLYSVDQEIQEWKEENRGPLSDDLSRFITSFGGNNLIGFMAALYLAGVHTDDSSLRKTALLSLQSFITSGIIVTGLKFMIGRARPRTGETSTSFHPLTWKPQYYSLPSGHASSAFAVATTIAEQSENPAVDFLAYSLAALVALSRVHENAHWISDVFIGSAIGYFVAKKICALNRGQGGKKLSVGLHSAPGCQALTLSYSF